jgi:hypothetical protein
MVNVFKRNRLEDIQKGTTSFFKLAFRPRRDIVIASVEVGNIHICTFRHHNQPTTRKKINNRNLVEITLMNDRLQNSRASLNK